MRSEECTETQQKRRVFLIRLAIIVVVGSPAPAQTRPRPGRARTRSLRHAARRPLARRKKHPPKRSPFGRNSPSPVYYYLSCTPVPLFQDDDHHHRARARSAWEMGLPLALQLFQRFTAGRASNSDSKGHQHHHYYLQTPRGPPRQAFPSPSSFPSFGLVATRRTARASSFWPGGSPRDLRPPLPSPAPRALQ